MRQEGRDREDKRDQRKRESKPQQERKEGMWKFRGRRTETQQERDCNVNPSSCIVNFGQSCQ